MSRAREREAYRYLGNAEERFKLDGRSRLGWSTLVAAALHVIVFVSLPSWRGQARIFDMEPFQGAIEWVVLTFPILDPPADEEQASGGDAAGEDVVVAVEAEEEPGDDVHALVGETPGITEGLREILLNSTIVPTLAQPVSADLGSPDQAAGSGPTGIEGGGASTVGLEGLAAADSLALALLNALRPELVLLDPTTWILIRNPTVVDNFMRLRAAELPNLNGGRHSTTVALWIDDSGSVEWAEVSRSSGRTELDELALELFSEVVSFRPARDHGARIPTTALFTVHFPW